MSKCPVCGCGNFYLKDPADEYETFPITVNNGAVTFSQRDVDTPPVDGRTRIHCDVCTWNGCLDDLTER